MTPSGRTFFGELKERKIRKTLAIYISSALTTIAILKLVAETYQLPTTIFPIVVTFLICGLASAFVFAWYHGKEGEQKFQKREFFLHTILLLLALVIAWQVGGSSRPPLLAPNAKTVAVLPFKNLGGEKEDEYFSDGITEDILTQLSKIGDLKVISRTSTMKYKDSEKGVREIGEELGAGSILEGTVRRVGARVRITSQLINARADEHVWAEVYDREMKDIFAIQSDVAQAIAGQLKAKLLPEEKERIEKKATENPDAYAFYLKGRDHYYRFTKEDNETAIALFERALDLDSTYALAYAGIADAYAQRYQRFNMPLVWVDSAVVIARRAIRLDPNIAEPYKALGLAYTQKGLYTTGLLEYNKAIKINPNFGSVIANIGQVKLSLGQHDEAYPFLIKAIALTPDRYSYYHTLALLYHELLMDSSAEALLRKAIALQPSFSYAYADLCKLYLANGKAQMAADTAAKALRMFPDDEYVQMTAAQVALFSGDYKEALRSYQIPMKTLEPESKPTTYWAFTLWQLGRKGEAEKHFNQIIPLNLQQVEAGNQDAGYRLDMARIEAIHGRSEEALTWLQRSIDAGVRNVRELQLDPMLEPLRSQPRFQQMMTDLRAAVERMRDRVLQADLQTN